MCELHGVVSVQSAVEAALTHPAVSRETVRYQLRVHQAAACGPPEPVTFAGPRIEQGSASAYASLMAAQGLYARMIGLQSAHH